MPTRPFEYLTSHQLPTGRRLFVLKAIRKLAEGFGDDALVAECDEAIALDRDTLRVELSYERAKGQQSRARGDAASIDAEIDKIFGGMYSVADGQTVGATEQTKLAEEFLVEVFPSGLGGLVKLTFEDQLSVEEMLLARFDDDLSGHVDALGLRGHADRLVELVPAFRAELAKENGQEVTYADVKEARRNGLDRFAEVMFWVLATYRRRDAAAKLEQLLAEYHRQNKIVSDAYRRNEPIEDIDPDAEEPASDEDVVEPVV